MQVARVQAEYMRQWVEEKDHQRKLQRVTPSPVQGVFAPMAEGKRQQRKLQPVTATMCASGVLALVDRRITPQVQGAKVRAQGAKVRTEGAKVRDQHQRKSVRDAATTFNDNHHHHRPGPTQHDAAMTATCVRVCKEFMYV